MSLKNRNNIKRIYNKATPQEIIEGVAWYAKAQEDAKNIAVQYDIPLSLSLIHI